MSSVGSMQGGFAGGQSAMFSGVRQHHHHHRPDAGRLAEQVYTKLDSTGQGYVEQGALEAAFDKVSPSGGGTQTADQMFAALDTDTDGKLTQEEFTSGIRKLAEALHEQFHAMRAHGHDHEHGHRGGFTQEELQARLDRIAGTDSPRAAFLTRIIENFDAVDTNDNGKVSRREAWAFMRAANEAPPAPVPTEGEVTDTTATPPTEASSTPEVPSTEATPSATTTTETNASTTGEAAGTTTTTAETAGPSSPAVEADLDLQVMMKIIQLLRAYNRYEEPSTPQQTIAVSA